LEQRKRAAAREGGATLVAGEGEGQPGQGPELRKEGPRPWLCPPPRQVLDLRLAVRKPKLSAGGAVGR